jgi:ferric-dicitrate binding protein FerR (iron transport regulator)
MQEMDEQIVLLLYKHVAGQELEKEEITILESWLAQSSHHLALLKDLTDEAKLENEVKALLRIDEDAALKKLQDRIAIERRKVGIFSFQILRFIAAAVVVMAMAAGVYMLYHRPSAGALVKKENSSQRFKNDIAPGNDNALLQLADGSTIAPEKAGNGILKYEDGTAVRKEQGQLMYDAPPIAPGIATKALIYNTITTPRKSRYRVVLPDGSKVWLNAGSSLRFPVSFKGARREVELKGEAYFEVAAQVSLAGGRTPFMVKITGASEQASEVEVMGTRFDINAYPDEATINTTLFEGHVLLRPSAGSSTGSQPKQPIELGPGQQARLARDGSVQVLNPDMEQALAWKNNLFLFHDTDIETIMRMVSRWYDVSVVYEGKTTQAFNGKISRDTSLSKLLTILELTGDIYFTIEGDTVTVKSLQ